MGVARYKRNEKDGIEEVILQSGINVKPRYGPEDLEEIEFEYAEDLGDPGEYPFTRGIHPQGYRSRAWTTRQYSGFGTPEETNERFKLLISHGQTGLNVAFDLPTQMGSWIYPVEDAVRLIGDTIEYSIITLPRCNPVSVCGYHIRESGASPSQEIAFALEIANSYIDEAISRGLSIDDVARRITFNFNIFGNLWEQVAKFRAARKLWAENLKEKYGAENPKSMHLRGLFGGGGFGLTKAQPENNIIRSAYYALGAALAGAQTTALCSFDEAFTIPTPRAALLSLRTCELLMDEIGLRDTVDPLAGSYFIETLTIQMEEKIQQERKKIQDVGGMINAVSSGFVQKLVAQQAYRWEKGLKAGEYIKIGVNKYVDDQDEPEVDLHEYDSSTQEKQIQNLKQVKAERNDSEDTSTLTELERVSRDSENVMPVLVECCKAYATVGEMADVFRNVFGEFKEPSIF
ncbi:MAG: methylmalonyl-CoA mutase family protein [Deltaproteobacteria bacterium]